MVRTVANDGSDVPTRKKHISCKRINKYKLPICCKLTTSAIE